MAYIPTNWQNREVEKPNTYVMTNNADGTITLTASEGQIFNAGTPIIADNMNKIESELVISDGHIHNLNNPHSVTAAQVDAYTKAESDNKFATKANTYSITETENRYMKKSTVNAGFIYNNATASYAANSWETIYLPMNHYMTGDVAASWGYGFEINKGGYYLITTSLNFVNTVNFTTGYAAVDVLAGGNRYRVGGSNYNTNGHTSVGGSVVVQLVAGDTVAVQAKCPETFDISGTTTDIRSYLAVKELL